MFNENQILQTKTPGETWNFIEAIGDCASPNFLEVVKRQYVWLRAYYWEKYNIKLPAIQGRIVDIAQVTDWCVTADTFIDEEKAKADKPADAETTEIDTETSEQEWDDDAPGFISKADALRIAGGKTKERKLRTHLRTKGNMIRWMYNKKTHRCKVNSQDFKRDQEILTTADSFSEAAFEKMEERKRKIRENHKPNMPTY